MSQYNNQGYGNQPSSDEIDLREVFKAIGNFFSRIGRGIIHAVLAVKRASRAYRILILTSVVIFIGLGLYWHSTGKEYFSSSMVIESEYYDRDLMDGAIGELHALAEQEAYGSLARNLDISQEEAENIRGLKVETILSQDDQMLADALFKSIEASEIPMEELLVLREELLEENYKYRITVEVFSNDLLQNVENGLLHYLENNDYVERRTEIEVANLEALRGKLREERQKLDGLKTLLAESFQQMNENGRRGSNNVILGAAEGATDPLNVYREDIKMYNEELEINKKLALIENVEVIKSFTAFKQPANLSLIKVILLSGLVGLAAAYILVILLEINNALNRYEREREAKKQLV
ncbi:hypothetical protein [Nafulsella turpanensis]|uniref:hypothetical protein n=1 Tax=Nafulsella turpanensis TaxID=1265690 RepID=UPI00034565DB|nr:hypothetical protein [Nafulsella turpanensis]